MTRYACLAIVETLRLVSSPVKKRFPTYNHLVEAGLLTEEEKQALLSAECKSEFMNYIHWVPLTWASRCDFFNSFQAPRCLKITEKVSFNILSGQKFIENARNAQFGEFFENLKLTVKQCYQTGQFK